jgi:hypothetical protein
MWAQVFCSLFNMLSSNYSEIPFIQNFLFGFENCAILDQATARRKRAGAGARDDRGNARVGVF